MSGYSTCVCPSSDIVFNGFFVGLIQPLVQGPRLNFLQQKNEKQKNVSNFYEILHVHFIADIPLIRTFFLSKQANFGSENGTQLRAIFLCVDDVSMIST